MTDLIVSTNSEIRGDNYSSVIYVDHHVYRSVNHFFLHKRRQQILIYSSFLVVIRGEYGTFTQPFHRLIVSMSNTFHNNLTKK